jgi:hypothetical protein
LRSWKRMKKTRRCLLPEALCERTDPPHRKAQVSGYRISHRSTFGKSEQCVTT